MNRHEALIVGAGPAGLAAAAMLKRKGIEPLILERSDRVGPRWHTYYDRLRLQSPRWMTNLPGYRFRRRAGRWPGRDAVIEYLEQYAAHHKLEIRFGAEVTCIDRSPSGWKVDLPDGALDARFLVVATGYNNVPFVPRWDGVDDFEGQLLHGSQFMNAAPFEGKSVLVVGGGNSGAEIAAALGEGQTARVMLSVRTSPHVAPLQAFGLPSVAGVVMLRRLPTRLVDLTFAVATRMTVGDLSPYGLTRPEVGLWSKYVADGVTPILDTGIVDLIKRGRVEIVPAVKGFSRSRVQLAGDREVEPEVVIAATGYRQGLQPLVEHLGVLQQDGRPQALGAVEHPAAPGLFFLGYAHPLSGNIREMSIDARKIARAIDRARAGRRSRQRGDHRKRRPGIPRAHSSLTPPDGAGTVPERHQAQLLETR